VQYRKIALQGHAALLHFYDRIVTVFFECEPGAGALAVAVQFRH